MIDTVTTVLSCVSCGETVASIADVADHAHPYAFVETITGPLYLVTPGDVVMTDAESFKVSAILPMTDRNEYDESVTLTTDDGRTLTLSAYLPVSITRNVPTVTRVKGSEIREGDIVVFVSRVRVAYGDRSASLYADPTRLERSRVTKTLTDVYGSLWVHTGRFHFSPSRASRAMVIRES